jgi:hypothetical protein
MAVFTEMRSFFRVDRRRDSGRVIRKAWRMVGSPTKGMDPIAPQASSFSRRLVLKLKTSVPLIP